jgi:hypothetical protein
MQDGKFVYTRERRDDRLSCSNRKKVRRLQLYAEALPLAREEFQASEESEPLGSLPEMRIGDDGRIYAPDNPTQYYLAFASEFCSASPGGFASRQALTDLSVLPDYVPANEQARDFQTGVIPVDEGGAPLFFAVPESFETAKNDGERRQALLNELLERVPSAKAAVCAARAMEAEAVFGVRNLQPYYETFFAEDYCAERGSRQEGVWELNTLADNETIAKLPSGVRRFELPPEYAYLDLWRKIVELNPGDKTTLLKIAQEYYDRRQPDKALEGWKQYFEQEDLPEHSQGQVKAVLSYMFDPRVAIDSSSVVAGMKADLFVQYRDAGGAEIVVERLNLDEPMKLVRTREFWNDYLGGLNRVVSSALSVQLTPKDSMEYAFLGLKPKEPRDKLESFGVVGEEVARYSVEFEPSPNGFYKIARVDFPVDEPGAYLLEITAADGNKDVAVIWLRDVAVARERVADGCRYFTFDARTGEPLPAQKLELFAVAHRRVENPDSIASSYSASLKAYSRQTDRNGALFLPNVSSNREINDPFITEILVAIPKEGDKAGATQYAFFDFQGIWLGNRVGADGLRSRSSARLRFDQQAYQPGQKAGFKFIVGGSHFDTPAESMWAGQEVEFQVVGKNDVALVKQRVTLDQSGAFSGSFDIPADAEPGVYSLLLGSSDGYADRFKKEGNRYEPKRGPLGGGSFRIVE